jgi:hypothetical protein
MPLPEVGGPTELLVEALERPFTFTERAVPTPAEYRPQWRTSLVVLLIGACWGKRASWHQLHVLNWASRSSANQAAFQRLRVGQPLLDDVVVRYDPALDAAIDLALYDNLLERRSGETLGLTARGTEVRKQLLANDVLEAEKSFLNQVSPVSQSFVDGLIPRVTR